MGRREEEEEEKGEENMEGKKSARLRQKNISWPRSNDGGTYSAYMTL